MDERIELPQSAVEWIYTIAMEDADVHGPSTDDRSGWRLSDDGWSYPSFENVDSVETTTIGHERQYGSYPLTNDVDGQTDALVFHGTVETRESRKIRSATYNPPSKAHPAEYENRDVTLAFVLVVPLDDPCSIGGEHITFRRR